MLEPSMKAVSPLNCSRGLEEVPVQVESDLRYPSDTRPHLVKERQERPGKAGGSRGMLRQRRRVG